VEQEFQYLLDKISERRAQMATTLADGVASDYPEYKRICGVIQGLDFAATTINDLATRLEQQDE
jgi:hypothetical protein